MKTNEVKKTAEETSEFKYLKQLNGLTEDAVFVKLLQDLRNVKSQLDTVSKDLKEKERAKQEQRREEERRAALVKQQQEAEQQRRLLEEQQRLAAEEAEKLAKAEAKAKKAKEKAGEKPPAETPAAPAQNAQTAAAENAPAAPQPPVPEKAAEKTAEKAAEKPAEKPPVAAAAPVAPERPPLPATGRIVSTQYISGRNQPPATRSRQFDPNQSFRHGAQGTQAPRAPGAPGARPPFAPGQRPPLRGNRPAEMQVNIPTGQTRTGEQKKRSGEQNKSEDKKGMNMRTLIRKGFVEADDLYGEERMGSRKLKNKKVKDEYKFVPIKIEHAVITNKDLTVKILSEKIGKPATEIIKQLMVLGIMATVNSIVDFSAMELVANELGITLELKLDKTKEELLEDIHSAEAADTAGMVKRPPIVAVMGHVDHGKTSLLDAIRKTDVAEGEAGGITQHIGAYTIMAAGEPITFIDTPGHEAFTAMRARGAQVTDIAIIVVAADDGVMPQSIEAINHVKAAGVPIIVAINKIDKPQADAERIKQQLTNHGLLTEEWGGDIIMVPVSAKTGKNLDKLLESILLVAEVREFRADPGRKATGTIVEAQLDKGKGPVATVIVQNGTLRVGDSVAAGLAIGKIRAMFDNNGKSVKEAKPSYAVSVLGFDAVPEAGDILHVVDDLAFSKQLTSERRDKLKSEQIKFANKITLEDVLAKTNESHKTLNLIIKADVQGSVEALKYSLTKLANDEVKITIVHGGAGAVNKSDIMLAQASKAVIIGFNVKVDTDTKRYAEGEGVDVRQYSIIYEAIDDIEAMTKGMLAPVYREMPLGKAEVRNIFKVTGAGVIAGSYILDGKVARGCKARVKRGEETVFEGTVTGLKRFKDDAKEVAAGFECGISMDGFSAFVLGDIIEAYLIEQVKPV